jgi:regulatory protein
VKDTCLRLLARREHSQQELLNKLALKGFDRSASQEVIDELAEQGWQSDQRFTESYSRHRIKQGYGPIKIANELKSRGIGAFDLDSVVLEVSEGWNEVLEQVYKKKYPDEKTSLLNKEWLKRCRFLQQRGFSGEMIQLLFKK